MTGYFTPFIDSLLQQTYANTLRVYLLTSTYFPDLDEHKNLDDVPQSAIIADLPLANTKVEGGVIVPQEPLRFAGKSSRAGDLHGILLADWSGRLVAYLGHEYQDRAFSASEEGGDLILNFAECGLIGL